MEQTSPSSNCWVQSSRRRKRRKRLPSPKPPRKRQKKRRRARNKFYKQKVAQKPSKGTDRAPPRAGFPRRFFPPPLLHLVVRRLTRDDHVVHMAFAQARDSNPHEPGALLQLGKRTHAA